MLIFDEHLKILKSQHITDINSTPNKTISDSPQKGTPEVQQTKHRTPESKF